MASFDIRRLVLWKLPSQFLYRCPTQCLRWCCRKAFASHCSSLLSIPCNRRKWCHSTGQFVEFQCPCRQNTEKVVNPCCDWDLKSENKFTSLSYTKNKKKWSFMLRFRQTVTVYCCRMNLYRSWLMSFQSKRWNKLNFDSWCVNITSNTFNSVL